MQTLKFACRQGASPLRTQAAWIQLSCMSTLDTQFLSYLSYNKRILPLIRLFYLTLFTSSGVISSTIIKEYFFKYLFSPSLNAAFGYYTFITPRFGQYTSFSFLIIFAIQSSFILYIASILTPQAFIGKIWRTTTAFEKVNRTYSYIFFKVSLSSSINIISTTLSVYFFVNAAIISFVALYAGFLKALGRFSLSSLRSISIFFLSLILIIIRLSFVLLSLARVERVQVFSPAWVFEVEARIVQGNPAAILAFQVQLRYSVCFDAFSCFS